MKKQSPLDDPIRLEIETLQLGWAKKRPFCEQILESCPLVPLAVGMIIGLVLQRHTDWPLAVWIFLVGMVAAASLFLGKICPQSRRLPFLLGLYTLASLIVGAIRLDLFQRPSPLDIRQKITSTPTLASLGGTILTEPQIENRHQWVFGKYQWTPPSTSFLFEVEEALTIDGWQQARGTLAVSVNQPIRSLSAGQRIRFHCTLQTPPLPDNPGMFNYSDTLASQGIFLTAEIPGPEAIEADTQKKRDFLKDWIGRFRIWAAGSLGAFGGEYIEYSSLPDALLLGQRSRLDPQIQAAFRKTGLAHFISLSGMHVGILAGILWQTGRLLGISKQTRSALCMLLLLAYAVLVPPRAPTLRAVLLAQFLFLSILLKQHPRPLNTLALTAIVLLLVRPTELFTAGWQLSFASVVGILLFYDPIFLRLSRWFLKIPLYSGLLKTLPGSFFALPIQSAVKLFSVGAAAWFGGAGILLYHFGSLTPLSPLWTVLLFPLVFLILLIGFLKIFLLPLLPTAAAVCSVLLDFLSDSFCTMTAKAAAADVLSFQIGRTGPGIILLYYLWLAAARWLPARMNGKPFLVWTGLTLLLLFPAAAHLGRTRSTDLKLTCLSVGHGTAVVGQFPGGKTFLFDAGSITRKNPGGRIIVPFLLFEGIQSIDLAILSHGDLDHYNGLPEVLDSISTQAVSVNPGLLERAERSQAAAVMKNLLEAQNLLYPSPELPPTLGSVQLRRLWPPLEVLKDPSVSDNNKSEVLLLEYAGRTILLCGDIEEAAQRQIGQRYPDLKVDVLLLPHHGSGKNNLPGWIRQLQPSVRVVSCAARRLVSVLPLDDSGINYYTPTHGAVTITIKADGTLSTAGFLDN